MADLITIGLVEDQVLFRESMRLNLNAQPDLQVNFESGDGFSVIEKLNIAEERPSLIISDLTLPANGHEEYSGLELTRDLCQHFAEIPVLILSMHTDPYFIATLIENGARGYLTKDSSLQEVFEAVRTISRTGAYMNANTLAAIQGRLKGKNKPIKPIESLSSREQEVLQLICQQMTTSEIGEQLFISPKTVEGHRNSLLQKTNSRNVTGLVMYAIKKGIVEVV